MKQLTFVPGQHRQLEESGRYAPFWSVIKINWMCDDVKSQLELSPGLKKVFFTLPDVGTDHIG
jgi:hypothetical protein